MICVLYSYSGTTTIVPNQQQLMQASATANTYSQAATGIVQGPAPQIITNSSGQVFAMAHPNIVQPQQQVSVPVSSSVSFLFVFIRHFL